jgi:hypothetical protein
MSGNGIEQVGLAGAQRNLVAAHDLDLEFERG